MSRQNAAGMPEPAPSSEPTLPVPSDAADAAAVEMWEQSGADHWLPIAGYSMKPLLREGDAVLVAHGRNEIRRGDVVVFRQDGGLVAHRVLRIGGGSLGCTLITKGDSLRRFDAPVSARQIVGRVVSIERRGRYRRLDTPGWWAVGWLVSVATLAVAMLYRRARALKRWVGL